jgi:hypothetical protein
VFANVVLTWEADVNQIIAYASRAFALYYTLQCVVAIAVARRQPDAGRRPALQVRFAALAGGRLAVFLLGLPAEQDDLSRSIGMASSPGRVSCGRRGRGDGGGSRARARK